MNKNRLEAFSDGVLAIIITIMVLGIRTPKTPDWDGVKVMLPSVGSYLLSFLFIGIYWANHHHLLHTLRKVNGKIMWANLHLLFWLSLVPIGTDWMSDSKFEPLAVSVYGALLVACGLAYNVLAGIIAASHPQETELSKAFEKMKSKGVISTVLYLSSVPLAFLHPSISCAIFAIVALMWIIPNKDVEKALGEG